VTEVATGGRFGPYGGRYVPETLMHALEELTHVYDTAASPHRLVLTYYSSAKT